MLSWYLDPFYDLFDDLINGGSFHFLFRRQYYAMTQDGRCGINDVFRCHKIPAPHSRQGLAPVEDPDGGAGRSTQVYGLVITGRPYYGRYKVDELFFHVPAAHFIPQGFDPVGRQHGLYHFDALLTLHRVVVGHDVEFLFPGRGLDVDLKQETVQLSFRQMVGAFLFDGVLRSYHHERGLQVPGLAVNGDLPFLHYFEESRLGFGRSTVDLVYQNDIAEDRAGFKLEIAFPGIEHGSPDDIAGHQVRGKLDAGKTNGNGPAKELSRQCLGNPGHAFDQDVTIRQNAGQQQFDHGFLADDDFADLCLQLLY